MNNIDTACRVVAEKIMGWTCHDSGVIPEGEMASFDGWEKLNGHIVQPDYLRTGNGMVELWEKLVKTGRVNIECDGYNYVAWVISKAPCVYAAAKSPQEALVLAAAKLVEENES